MLAFEPIPELKKFIIVTVAFTWS